MTDLFRLKERARGDHLPEAVAKAGTYIVTLKCEGEAPPKSHQTHLMVALSHSELRYRERVIRLCLSVFSDPTISRILFPW